MRELPQIFRKKDQVIIEYLSKMGRCNRKLEVIQKRGTSVDVIIEVVRGLVADITS